MDEKLAIQVVGLSKKYQLKNFKRAIGEFGHENNDFFALKDLSFEVKKGDSIGIIGKNGSGKSTLLKILSGITKPTSGSVKIRGKIASILDIGAGFHPELTGIENIYLNAQLHGFSRKETQYKLNEIIEFSGISDFIEEPVKNFSNGMFLRLAFSIIAHLDFDVYLFDEVFAVGDATFYQKAKNKFIELQKAGKTILFVSHNVNEIQWNEKFMLLEDGMLKKKIEGKKLLSLYLEETVKNFNLDIITKSIELTNFSRFQQPNEFQVKTIRLTQKSTPHFQTNEEFIFEVECENVSLNNLNIQPVLIVSDINENVVLSSSPFLSENWLSNVNAIRTDYCCRIPPHFFSSQVYRLGLSFIKIDRNFQNTESVALNADNFAENTGIEMILFWNNLILFKPIFKIENFNFDLSQLNLNGALLPAFDWKMKEYEH